MIKNIILTSAIEDKNYKGIVTLENTSERTLVSLKMYNLPITSNKRVLGVLIDGDLYKVTLNSDSTYLIDKKTDLNNKISVVLLEIENNTSKILIWGSNETNRVWKNNVALNFELEENKIKNESFTSINTNFSKTNTYFNENNASFEKNENINQNNDNTNTNFNKDNIVAKDFIKKIYTESKLDEDIESDEYIENLIDESLKQEEFTESFLSYDNNFINSSSDFRQNNKQQIDNFNINNKSYENVESQKNIHNFENNQTDEVFTFKNSNSQHNNNIFNQFSSNENNSQLEENEILDDILIEDKTNNKSEFFKSVESQIEELLNTYEEEKALEEIIPNSKFVKVDLEKNGNFYIFGVIYENSDIKYIVYGLPGEYDVKPDDEYSKFYQWLPINSENPKGYGYYLMYQDASSGNQIEMIIEEK